MFGPEDESLAGRRPGRDLLSPYPVAGQGARIGYARVSTRDQNLARQEQALARAGCIKIFSDKLSGKNADREGLRKCLEYARSGDTVVVLELSRLGRSLQDLINIVSQLRLNGVGFMSLKENIDTTTPGGRLVFHIFASLAEFIRDLIIDGTNDGIAVARASGKRLGRPNALSPEQIAAAVQLLASPTATISSVAKLFGVSRPTLYRHVPGLRGPAAIDQQTVLTKGEIMHPQPPGHPVPDPAMEAALRQAGVDSDAVSWTPDDVFTASRTDGTRLSFGAARDSDGGDDVLRGWDFTQYGADDEIQVQDWAMTAGSMAQHVAVFLQGVESPL